MHFPFHAHSDLNLQISHQPTFLKSLRTFNEITYQTIAVIEDVFFIPLTFKKQTKKSQQSLSPFPLLCLDIISPYTQFADRGLFHRALCVSLRGSVVLVYPLPRHPLPLTDQLPAMNRSLLNLKGANLLVQILCCSHR